MLSQKVHENNLIEGISVLCNDYVKCAMNIKHCNVTEQFGGL